MNFNKLKIRSLIRKTKINEFKSSYPFISGDTFRSKCDLKLDTFLDLNKLAISSSRTEIVNIYIAAPVSFCLLNWLEENLEIDLTKKNLWIHNGDEIPSSDDMQRISERFASIKSVNWLGSHTVARPIPIGLENFSHMRNGVPVDYLRRIQKIARNPLPRSIFCLSSFSTSTNPVERGELAKISRRNPKITNLDKPVPPRKFQELLSVSKFVLSPPGNGADCHRTWESMYLGAIPIVKRKYWPFQEFDLPILILDEWEELDEKMNEFKIDVTSNQIVEKLAMTFLKNI